MGLLLYFLICPLLSGFVYILPETPYPVFRLIVIFIGLALAIGIYILVAKTRMGAMVRAGAANPDMTAALGVNIHMLRRFIFSVGASLAGVAGMMLAPLTVVEPAWENLC